MHPLQLRTECYGERLPVRRASWVGDGGRAEDGELSAGKAFTGGGARATERSVRKQSWRMSFKDLDHIAPAPSFTEMLT